MSHSRPCDDPDMDFHVLAEETTDGIVDEMIDARPVTGRTRYSVAVSSCRWRYERTFVRFPQTSIEHQRRDRFLE